MCADSLVSLIPVVAEYVLDLARRKNSSQGDAVDNKEDHEIETEDRLVPNSWVIIGVIASIFIGTILVWIVFGNEGIKPWATVLGFILGGLLSILGYVTGGSTKLGRPFTLFDSVRALGETDINPVSGLGKISQLFFAWIQPGNIVANIIAGGVAEAGAQQ